MRSRVGWSAVPLVFAALAGLLAALVLPRSRFLALYALLSLAAVAGRFAVLAPSLDSRVPFTSSTIALAVVVVDLCLCWLVAANLDLLHRVPWLGDGLARLQTEARHIVSTRRSLRGITWFGVLAFVALPILGSGPVGGTMAARIAGLSRKASVAAVTVGTVLGVILLHQSVQQLGIALSPEHDGSWFATVRLMSLGVLLLLLGWLGRWRARRGDQQDPE